jgi:hypothetical protein
MVRKAGIKEYGKAGTLGKVTKGFAVVEWK